MDAECKTLWMGDIQPHWDEAFIGSLFATCSEQPVVKLIRDKITGYPSGYGFLEFPTAQGAQHVLETFNGQVIPNTIQRFRMNWGAGGRRIETSEDFSIFVGDLAPEVGDDLLLSTFATRFPSVRSAKVVTDAMTRMSKGFGFVRFGSKDEADQALQTMNGVYCSSRPMRVSVATDRNAGRNRGMEFQMQMPMHGAGSTEAEGANTTVFVGGLDASATEEDLRSRFGPFGDIVSVKVPPGRGCGFVQFMTKESAEMAISQMNGALLNASKIRCAWGRSAAVRVATNVVGTPATGGAAYFNQYNQYAQPSGYPNYYAGYGNNYYAQYPQAGFTGYDGYAAYDQQGSTQQPGAATYQQQQQQPQVVPSALAAPAPAPAPGGYVAVGNATMWGSYHRPYRPRVRDFTKPDDTEAMNRSYAAQHAFQHLPPAPTAAYTPMRADVSKGTAMVSE